MKNERQIALNRSFVALIVSSIFALVAWWFGKPLFHAMELPGLSLPQISIWWLVPIVTLMIFGSFYFLFLAILEEIKSSIIIGGIIGGIIGFFPLIPIPLELPYLVVAQVLYIFFGSNLVGFLAMTVFLNMRKGSISGIILSLVAGCLSISVTLLDQSSRSIGEVLGLSIIVGFGLMISIIITQTVVPFFFALVERVIMIGKTPEFNGVNPPVQEA